MKLLRSGNFRPDSMKAITGKAASIGTLAAIVVLTLLSGNTMAENESSTNDDSQSDATRRRINYNLPEYHPVTSVSYIGNGATAADFRNLTQFPEALIPTSDPSSADNAVFASAVNAFLSRTSTDDFSALENFTKNYPSSPWNIAALVNLGLIQQRSGYFSKAIENFRSAWNQGKTLITPEGVLLADQAFSSLLVLDSSFGQAAETMALMEETKGRTFTGNAPRQILLVQKIIADMKLAPNSPVFQCGPTSVGLVANAMQATNANAVVMSGHHAVADTNGFNLRQLGEMAQQFGLPLQMAYREKGAPVITPAVMNTTLHHYSALVQATNDRYILQDSSLNSTYALTKAAIDSESSGYFLVPIGKLPHGWRTVSSSEASSVWGTGGPAKPGPPPPKPCPPPQGGSGAGGSCGGNCGGMPVAKIKLHEASAYIEDTPIGYQPPVGSAIEVRFSIDQGDLTQPTSFNFSNMGSFGFFPWIGYIEFNPSTPSGDVTLHARGGGVETYQQYNASTKSYLPGKYTDSVLSQLSPTTFVRSFNDGSREYYQQDDGVAMGAGVTFKRAFLSQIIDPKGNTITLTYDSLHRLIGITDAIGQVTTLSYDNSGDPYKITKVTDPFGRTASFTYGVGGVLASSTDVLGLTSTFTYNGSTLTSFTTPYGTTTIASGAFSGNNVWVQITDPLGAVERAEAWPNGLTGAPQTDPLGYPTGMAIADGGSGQYLQYRTTYFWGKHAMKVAPGDYTAAHAYQYNHDASYGSAPGVFNANLSWEGNTLESEKPPGASRIWYNYPGAPRSISEGTSASPSAIGRIVQDANGNNVSQVTRKSYNALGNVTQVIDPAGRITTNTYDTNGIDVLQVKQGGQVIASYTYNSQHLPLTETDAAGQTTTYTYNAYGKPLTVTNPKGEVTTYSYDANGYLLSVTRPLGATTTYTYDQVGRTKTVTDPNGYTLTYDYDNLDHVIRVTYPDGTTQLTTYDRLDVSTITDREGRTTHQWWDANRHMIVSQDPLGRTTQFNWCACGTLMGMTDANGNTTKFGYDSATRLISKTYADGKGESYTYDLSGRSSTVTDALGQVRTTRYNKDDTVASVSYTNAATPPPSIGYSWDANFRRITSITDGSGTNSFSYAPYGSLGGGKPSSITTPLATLTYAYDQLGRVTNRAVGGSNSESIAYDALGRATNVTNPLGSFVYSYVDATARLASVTMPAGLSSTYSYYGNTGSAGNEDQRLSGIVNSIGGVAASQFAYSYDVAGNITQWGQTQPGAMTNGVAWSNQYDAADQLTAAAISDTASSAILTNNVFAYDPVGNRLSKQQNSSLVAGTFNNLNQLTSLTGGNGRLQVTGSVNKTSKVTVQSGTNSYLATTLWGTNFQAVIPATLGTNSFSVVAQDANTNLVTNNYQIAVNALEGSRNFTYDANGNCLSDGQRTYTWDAANRLASVTVGTNTYSFGYDYAGRRISEKLNGTLVKQTLWDPAGNSPIPLEERTAANTVAKRFYAQGEQQGGTNYYYLRDHLGSIREMVNASGSIVSEATFDPYGVATVSGSVTPTFQYAGYYTHQGTGLDLTWYRAYDPVIGRWLSRDPIGVMGGINLYGYVGDNPVNDIDPYGKSAREAYFIYCKCKCEKEWRKVKLVVKEKLILADAITPTQSTILINRNDYNKIRNEQNENPNTPANPLTTGDGSWTLLSHMLAHECGHTCQAKVLGPVYLPWAVLNSGIENIIGYDDNMNNLSTPNERNASQNGMFGGFAQ